MKTWIAYPPLEGKGTAQLGQNRQFQWFHNPSFIYPMVPASAATLLKRNGYNVEYLDYIAENRSFEEFMRYFEKKKPELAAFETKTPVVKQHWKIIDELKEISNETKFVLMGDHVTCFPEESFRNSKVDFVLTGGDYDFLLLSVADYLDKKKELDKGIYYRESTDGPVKNTGKFVLNHDLDSLPFIDRKLTKWELYGEKLFKRTPHTYTMAGRDCWWAKCRFCSWTTLFPQFRSRSPQNVLDEIGMLIKKYNIREIFDDTGTFPAGKWLEEFCTGMVERGFNEKLLFSINYRVDVLDRKIAQMMKKAGFRLMKVGIESANETTLERLKKGTSVSQMRKACKAAKEAGLEVHLTIMIGYPWETKKQALKTLNLAKEFMHSGLADLLQSTVVVPYPGTPLYEEAKQNDWLIYPEGEWENYDMTKPVLKTPDMTPEEVMKICHGVYRTFIHPKYVFHHLKKMRSLEDISYTFQGVKAVFGHLLDFARKE